MQKKDRTSMHLLATAAITLWGVSYVFTRVAMRHFTTEAASFLRYLTAAVFILIFAAAKRLRLPKLRDVPLFLLGGAMGFSAYGYSVNEGSKTLTASVVSLIISATPVMAALLARVFLRERIGLKGWLAILLAFCGVGVITLGEGGFALSSGAVWVCFAMLLNSAYNILQRKLLKRYTPLEITAYGIIAAALELLPFAPGAFPQLRTASPAHIGSIAALGIFAACIAYLCWCSALSKAEKTGQVTQYMFLTPLVATLSGFVLIGEAPPLTACLGGGMVLAGVILMNRRPAAAPADAPLSR